jgi:tRNA threonylcarbamoyladenosine biosynthesis protein TsaB
MKILALETSATAGSVAITDGERLLIELSLPADQRSARTLASAMHKALRDVGWRASEVELVAVTTGPGSFTGLRVGVVTAKTFAYAVGCQVIGVNTLEAIASGVAVQDADIATVIDAQRSELFTARWRRGKSESALSDDLRCLDETKVMSFDVWMKTLKAGDYVVGAGLEKLCEPLPPGVNVAAGELWQPRAQQVAALGLQAYRKRGGDDLFSLVPKYGRRTAAEEQWDQRHGKEIAVD